jgi:recombinational DNA repair protein RecR
MAKDNQQKCQNCGNEVENDYCSFCGQVYESKIKPIASFIRDFGNQLNIISLRIITVS